MKPRYANRTGDVDRVTNQLKQSEGASLTPQALNGATAVPAPVAVLGVGLLGVAARRRRTHRRN